MACYAPMAIFADPLARGAGAISFAVVVPPIAVIVSPVALLPLAVIVPPIAVLPLAVIVLSVTAVVRHHRATR